MIAPILLTRVVCRAYDLQQSGCRCYEERSSVVEGCVRLTAQMAAEFEWLPESCAYRLRAQRLELLSWHPLRMGDPLSVRPYGILALNPVMECEGIDFEEFILDEGEES